MDFKLSIWDRQNNITIYEPKSFINRSNSDQSIRNKLYNKKKSQDIIIDCEVEVIEHGDVSSNTSFVYYTKERLLK